MHGKHFLLTYGFSAGAGVDPIEKKPFYHFLPGTSAFSFGTFGCNFRCGNCQNFDISQILGVKGQVEKYNFSWGADLSPLKAVRFTKDNNCASIAYTYNEPSTWVEYALETMKLAKSEGLKNVWVSNGYMSDETLDLIAPYLDAINIDIKSFDDSFYRKNCGATVQPILDNCKKIFKKKIWLELTTLVIPTLSDNPKMIKQIANFIKNELADYVPWHLTAFSGAISWKMQDVPDTDVKTLIKLREIGSKAGLKYVYIGNVREKGLSDTTCPECKNLVLERLGYDINRMDINGKCRSCKTNIKGVWN